MVCCATIVVSSLNNEQLAVSYFCSANTLQLIHATALSKTSRNKPCLDLLTTSIVNRIRLTQRSTTSALPTLRALRAVEPHPSVGRGAQPHKQDTLGNLP